MRAVWYDRQGTADEVLVCGELPTPEAGYGEVRVRLEASGVNPSDTYRRRGPPAMEYPRVVTNSDGAGVVDQVGPGVPERWLGKRVWLETAGAHKEVERGGKVRIAPCLSLGLYRARRFW
jgi:NADPH:quinone reductase